MKGKKLICGQDEGFALLELMAAIPLWTMLAFGMLAVFMQYSGTYINLLREWELTEQWRDITHQLIWDTRYAEGITVANTSKLVLKQYEGTAQLREVEYSYKRSGGIGVLYRDGQPVYGNTSGWKIDVERFAVKQEKPYSVTLDMKVKDVSSGKTLELNTRIYGYTAYRSELSNVPAGNEEVDEK